MWFREWWREKFRASLESYMRARGVEDHQQSIVRHILILAPCCGVPTGDLAKLAKQHVTDLGRRVTLAEDQRAFDELQELRGFVDGLTRHLVRPREAP